MWTFSSLTLNGTLPAACTASVWKMIPFSFAIAPISAIGWMTPISFFGGVVLHKQCLLVVGGHDRNQDRLVGDRVAEVVEADQAVLLYRQVGHPVAVLLEGLARVDHRLVLGDRSDEMVALLAVHLGDALDRQVVRLGGAAGEHDLFRVRADEIGDLLARLVDCLLGRPPERMVAAGGIAEHL